MTTKERLKQYIEKDEIYQNYKQNKLMNSNDFDKFCIQHCKDIDELLEENQQLKQKYENAVADYETTMFEKEQLNSLVNSCQEEIRQLKKQLEEYKDKINWYENFEINKTIDKLRIKHNNQQKEFIEYMNKTIEELECDDVDDEEMKGYLIQRIDTFKEILQKYRSIIGVSDEKEN